jgi:hypothetical protein
VIVPVGEDPPLNTAVSRIAPPGVADADLVDSRTVAGGTAGVGGARGLCGVAGGGGAGGGGGSTGATGQFAIVNVLDPELELPSRVCAEVHDDDAVTTPLPLGIATVSENELPANDATPCSVVVEPPLGLNAITHGGVFSPPLPFPDELKLVQSKVTDLHVAVAVTVCACALAAKIASNAPESAMMLRDRRTIARLPARIAAGVNISIVIAGTPLDRVVGSVHATVGSPREATSDEELSRGGRQLRRASGRVPGANVRCSKPLGPRVPPTG